MTNLHLASNHYFVPDKKVPNRTDLLAIAAWQVKMSAFGNDTARTHFE
jgi:hypothetical protein